MKKIILISMLFLFIQNSHSQSCGMYRVKLTGKINSGALNIERIKIPDLSFLHKINSQETQIPFTEIVPENNKFIKELQSPLTSDLFNDAQSLMKFYKSRRQDFPLILYGTENGIAKEITVKIKWENITISKLEDGGFGNYFEISLNEINVQ